MNLDRKRELDREKKRRKYLRDPEKQKIRSKKHYENNKEYYITKSARNKDENNPERIINRVLKHIKHEPNAIGSISNSVDEAIKLCVAKINQSFTRKDS